MSPNWSSPAWRIRSGKSRATSGVNCSPETPTKRGSGIRRLATHQCPAPRHSADKEVDHRTEDSGQDDYQDPDQLVIALPLIFRAVNQHPDPEGEHGQEHCQHEQKEKPADDLIVQISFLMSTIAHGCTEHAFGTWRTGVAFGAFYLRMRR